jgi:hypothetical protein
MPRTIQDFPGIDLGEQKNVSYTFGRPGQPSSPLGVGETVTSVTFQIWVVSGADPNPSACLKGSPFIQFIQPWGLVVTQSVAPQVAGTVYLIMATAVTTSSPPQILTPWSHLPCNLPAS